MPPRGNWKSKGRRRPPPPPPPPHLTPLTGAEAGLLRLCRCVKHASSAPVVHRHSRPPHLSPPPPSLGSARPSARATPLSRPLSSPPFLPPPARTHPHPHAMFKRIFGQGSGGGGGGNSTTKTVDAIQKLGEVRMEERGSVFCLCGRRRVLGDAQSHRRRGGRRGGAASQPGSGPAERGDQASPRRPPNLRPRACGGGGRAPTCAPSLFSHHLWSRLRPSPHTTTQTEELLIKRRSLLEKKIVAEFEKAKEQTQLKNKRGKKRGGEGGGVGMDERRGGERAAPFPLASPARTPSHSSPRTPPPTHPPTPPLQSQPPSWP